MVSEAYFFDHFCRGIWFDMSKLQDAAVGVRLIISYRRGDRLAFLQLLKMKTTALSKCNVMMKMSSLAILYLYTNGYSQNQT